MHKLKIEAQYILIEAIKLQEKLVKRFGRRYVNHKRSLNIKT